MRAFVKQNRLASPSGRRTLVHLAGYLTLWAALGALAVGVPLLAVKVAAVAALAVVSIGLSAFHHEGSHHNLFASRWANNVAACVGAALMLVPSGAFRAYHLTHHAHTAADEDSEKVPEHLPTKQAYVWCALTGGPLFALLLWYGAFATLAGRPSAWVRSRQLAGHIRRSTFGSLACVAALCAATVRWPQVMVPLWAAPVALMLVGLFGFVSLSEHYGAAKNRPVLETTRSVRTNRLMNFIYWYNWAHAAHHLVPGAPPQNLLAIDEQIGDRHALRADGFVRFHRDMLRSLPWRSRNR